MFVNSHYFDNHMLKGYHNDFCELPAFRTVKEFAEHWFKDWKPETHEAWLKSKGDKKKRDYMRESRERYGKKQGANPKPKTVKIRPCSPKTQKIKSAESRVMREFWNENADFRGWAKCMETGVWLRGYDPSYVHHIWTKGSSERSRLDKENLVIVSYQIHNIIHTEGEKELKLYPYFLKVREKMKIKYERCQNRKAI